MKQKRENFWLSVLRHHWIQRLFPSIRNSSLKWSSMPYCTWMKICKRAILVSRRLLEVQSLTPSWLKVYALRKPSHMPVSNNNQNALKIQRLPSLILNLSLKLRKIMLKLELIIQRTSKRLLMPSGILFMISLPKLLTLELKLYFQTSQLVI